MELSFCLKSRSVALVAVVVFGATGCASTNQTLSISPIPETGVGLESGPDGQPMLYSAQSNLAIGVLPSASLWRGNGRKSFHLIVANLSDYAVRFGTDNVRVRYDGQWLDIVPPEDLVEEARETQEEAASRAANAEGRAGGFSWLGGVLRDGAGLTRSSAILGDNLEAINEGLEYAEQLETGAMVVEQLSQMSAADAEEAARAEERASARLEYMVQNYRQVALRDQVISVGGAGENIGGGLIYLDVPSELQAGGNLEILVDLDGDQHDFRFGLAAP